MILVFTAPSEALSMGNQRGIGVLSWLLVQCSASAESAAFLLNRLLPSEQMVIGAVRVEAAPLICGSGKCLQERANSSPAAAATRMPSLAGLLDTDASFQARPGFGPSKPWSKLREGRVLQELYVHVCI